MGAAFRLFLWLCLLPLPAALAAEPVLTISSGGRNLAYGADDLLKRKDLELVVVPADPAYPGMERRYKAVKFSALFGGLPIRNDDVLQFHALDGFSAPISRERVMNVSEEKGAVAYVAVEDPAAPWPALSGKGHSAGPFYLVWKNPEKSQIGPEEWPFQLSGFEVKGKLRDLYPGIFPATSLTGAEGRRVQAGFGVFAKNCFACHTLNQCGAAQVGPDLNLPMNPTEYFREPALRKLIRDPKSVRKWPKSSMNGFAPAVISEAELGDLLAYLRHMKSRKREACKISAK